MNKWQGVGMFSVKLSYLPSSDERFQYEDERSSVHPCGLISATATFQGQTEWVLLGLLLSWLHTQSLQLFMAKHTHTCGLPVWILYYDVYWKAQQPCYHYIVYFILQMDMQISYFIKSNVFYCLWLNTKHSVRKAAILWCCRAVRCIIMIIKSINKYVSLAEQTRR